MEWAHQKALKLLEPKAPGDAKYIAVLLATIIRLQRLSAPHEGEVYEHESR
jgi:hypothetical protein